MEKIGAQPEVIDLREYAKTNKNPPAGHHYQTLVDDELVIFEKENPTGREILKKAGKNPPECFSLYLKSCGCEPDRISLDETVDLINRGVEIFYTKPPEVFYYSVDDEPETTDMKEMTPVQIMVAAAVDPKQHYLVEILENGEQKNFKDHPEVPVKMRCPHMKFITVLDGPCPFSEPLKTTAC